MIAEQHLRTPAAAAQWIAARLAVALGGGGDAAPPGALRRIETRVQAPAPLSWLEAHGDWTQYYWSDRAGAFAMAGIGEADTLHPGNAQGGLEGLFAAMRARLGDAPPSLRYYGGFRFQPGKDTDKGARWRAFGDYRFVVPRFELSHRDGACHFACNVFVPEDAAARDALLAETLEALARVRFEAGAGPRRPVTLSRRDAPDRADWDALVGKALEAFASGGLEKVVLARETCFTADRPFDPVALLGRLMTRSRASFEFCFHPAPDRAFIGASPERLYRRRNIYVESEAVAGTRPRGRTDAEDAALGGALLASEKDLREHRFVVDALETHLGELCHAVRVLPGPELLRLRNVQHLHTRLEGLLHDPLSDAALIAALHPTPAVGGSPRGAALAFIAAHEPFDRGIYAAPVGWAGRDAAEFCVAIRSGLVQGRELAIYNGAGIVPGSEAEEEWAEIESKMANFLSVVHEHDP